MRFFHHILSQHISRYPLMEPEDMIKLCFQSEFGPEHLISNETAVERYILSEWNGITEEFPKCITEDIGNDLVRFHFTKNYDPELAAPILSRLFCLTAKTHQGTREGMEQRLRCAEELFLEIKPNRDVAKIKKVFSEYRLSGYPAIHHSEVFREKYKPHYRLLTKNMALYFPYLMEIQAMDGGILAIDGLCGSGKTEFARLIQQVFDCNVIHTDDFYLPMERRRENWQQIPAGNMDIQRIKETVLIPARAGSSVSVLPYSCRNRSYGEEKQYPAKKLTILEGSYSLYPELREYYDQKFFLTCQKETQRQRLEIREGDYVTQFEKTWIPMEQLYHKACPIPVDTRVIDTTEFGF